ncbi:MAG: hypothetical protein ACI4I0_05945 [Acutalibacteraceae bacterium]
MKIAESLNICASIATIAIAVCAIFGIQQTAKSLKETADINKMAAQYYSIQNAHVRPLFRIEKTKSNDFSDFSKDGWTLPFAPEDICKDINIYNDGAWIKNVDVTVQTYLMTFYCMLTANDTTHSVAMFVPVKDFYTFSQNGKVRGLIATGGSSKFQKKVMSQLRDFHNGTDGKTLAVCTPFNVYTIQYDDSVGNRHIERYSIDMEISGKELELEHDLLYSKELFKDRVFTIDDFDIKKIVEEYGSRSIELTKRYAEQGYKPEIYQDARPVFKKN